MKLKDFKLVDHSRDQELVSLILHKFNGTSSEYPKDKCIHELFKDIVAKHPDKEAVVYKNQVVTYKVLDEQSNRLANFLVDIGVVLEDPVALLMSPSVETLISLLGILKAGGSYVSINENYPSERIKHILNDTRAKILISTKEFISMVNKLQWECSALNSYICIDTDDVLNEHEEQNELMKKELWDYVGEKSTDDISGGGWINSYTGEKLSREVMDEYGDNIACKLGPLLKSTDTVLEIGCSSGISLFRLAPKVNRYVGVDLSSTILAKTAEEILQHNYKNISLHCLAAHEIDTLPEENYDVVILNSVIQCFSGYNYLRSVLRKAIQLMRNGGIIFLGDIMDLDCREALIESLERFKSDHAHEKYVTKTDWSNELFLSKAFIRDLQNLYPVIEDILISDKVSAIESELSQFRYDVIIKVNKNRKAQDSVSFAGKRQFDKSSFANYDKRHVPPIAKPENLAYITFTSGSTGLPKGILIGHKSVVRLVRNTDYIDIDPADRITQTAPVSFDASTFEIWGALLNGGSLHVIDRDQLLAPAQFSQILLLHKITICWLTSSLFNMMADQEENFFSGVNTLVVGGDVLSTHQINKVRNLNKSLKLVNGYGPTENTTFSCCYSIVRDHQGSIPIGRPISNSQCYIFNENNHLLPVGISGELHVAGDGLARGYLNDPTLTAEKFIYNQLLPHVKLYKTGDKAKWLSSGDIEFMGRMDNQIKIRGFRIELGEIENIISKYPGVKESVLMTRTQASNDKYICCYLVCTEEVSLKRLRDFLSQKLPEYMMPSFFIPLDKLPLTPNGKVDKKNLPDPGEKYFNFFDSLYVAPVTFTEIVLVSIWQEVLGLQKISVTSNFFEIGGHSLKATQVISRIKKEMKVTVSVREIFAHPNIKEIAKIIDHKTREEFERIISVPKQKYYELSHAQRRLWIESQLESNFTAYNMSWAYKLSGHISMDALTAAIATVIGRHEILRTNFIMVEGEPVQSVNDWESASYKINYYDVALAHDSGKKADEIIHQLTNAVYDLEKDPLFKASVIALSPDRYIFVLNVHHIVFDGWSINVLLGEINSLYNSISAGVPNTLNPLRIQYRDYTMWQKQQLNGQLFSEHRDYWLNQFKDGVPVLKLPLDFPRPALKTFDGKEIHALLDKELQTALTRLGVKYSASLFMTLVSVVNVLMYRYTGQDDLVLGSPIAGRDHPDLEDQIGFYVNNLALRTRISLGDTFEKILLKVKNTTLNAYQHQLYPFDCLVEDLELGKRDRSHSPVFDVMVALQNTDINTADEIKVASRSMNVSPYLYAAKDKNSKYDLEFQFIEAENGILLYLTYNTNLFKAERMQQLIAHLRAIIKQVALYPTQRLENIEYLSDTEQQQLLVDFNNYTLTFPQQTTISKLFEKQADSTPDSIAIVLEDTALTYRELDKRSNQLGNFLKERFNVESGDRIALMMDRSFEQIIGFLAILKLRAAYVPLDQEFPMLRIRHIVEDADVKILLTTENHFGEIQRMVPCPVVSLRQDVEVIDGWDDSRTNTMAEAEDLAYIIYTSGSTGKPKGVLVEHKGLINRISWMWKYYAFSERDVIYHKTSAVFDVSVWELFMTLCFGARMVLCKKDTVYDPVQMLNEIDLQKVTAMHFVPSVLNTFLEAIKPEAFRKLEKLRHVFASGEALSIKIVNDYYQKVKAPLHNLYGPTEASVEVSFFETKKTDACVLIGRPLPNISLYILDQRRKLVPVGIDGEICISGICLARGYSNNPELTRQKFIDNPFNPGEKMYLTGDVGKWLDNGNIEYKGRNDFQVKVRGYRVELGEIEAAMLRFNGIEYAIATAQPDHTEDVKLVAYFVGSKDIDLANLRSHLYATVPAYMVPPHLIPLEKLPLTISGKIDRSALPSPGAFHQIIEYVAPRTAAEEKMALIWSDVLKINKVGVNENFFELGGCSIKAMKVVSRVYKEFNVKLELKNIFEAPTIALQTNRIEAISWVNTPHLRNQSNATEEVTI